MILNKRLVTFLLVCLPALWIAAIAILSVQNATPVALQFLWFESVELPVGVVLSFCAAGAMVLTTGLLVALRSPFPLRAQADLQEVNDKPIGISKGFFLVPNRGYDRSNGPDG
jgi:uncharacterized integral membrane protein